MVRRITAALIMVLAFSFMAEAAAKWETMSFTDDVTAGLETLRQYCITHDVTVTDVLWANQTDEASLKAGTTIYLPKNQADMLAIWQHSGAWKPTALVPVTSEAAAKRAMNAENKPKPAPVSLSAVQKASAPKPAPAPVTAAAAKPAPAPVAVAAKPAPAPVTVAAAKPAPAKKTAQPSPAKVIAQTAKPDKILTAKKKTAQQEIPGLMDPIIVLSPNGDPSHGPMRLVISGDKVEVVQLPQSAAPKKPTVADANAPFTSSYSYLSYYSASGKPASGNILTNITNLNGKMMWPVDGKISSPFGKWRGKHKHEGIDIPMPAGTPIRAARNGVVARTGNNATMGFRGYGNFVMLDHGGNVKTFYAHCLSVCVVEGQRVMQGQVIAYVGNTGRSTANHLHFEVRLNNAKVNPIPYLAGNTHLASK